MELEELHIARENLLGILICYNNMLKCCVKGEKTPYITSQIKKYIEELKILEEKIEKELQT